MEDNMWKLYVLQRNGAYKCFRCNAQGSWYDLQDKMVLLPVWCCQCGAWPDTVCCAVET